MEALIQCILRMPAPIKKSSINSFIDSPFVDAIALVEMPRKFRFPNMKHYDATTDLDNYIAQYRQPMLMELTKYPCKIMEDILTKAWAQIKWEEYEVNYTPSRHNRNQRKSAERRPEPYPTSRRNRTSRNRPPRQAERTRARVPEYNLNITLVEAVAIMKNLGNSVKWPGRMSSPAKKRDFIKWCDFHRDNDHRTDDCILFKFEVVKLLKMGHLKEHLTNKGKSTLARQDKR
ncbi:hypothetical protein ACOSP7_010092 [Xanthoceras sorbifolium]